MSRGQITRDNTASAQAEFNHFSEVSADCLFVKSVVTHTYNLSPGDTEAGQQAEARLVYLVSLCLPGLYNEPLPLKEKTLKIFFF